MKKLIIAALSLLSAVSISYIAVAGSLDSPGAPSAGSGMYTLQNLYDYLTSGSALTVQTSFQEPTSGPGSTMKTTKEIGDDIKALFDLCATTTAADVKSGQPFFCTQQGSWGMQTGTAQLVPTPTPTPTSTPTPTATIMYVSCKAIKTATPAAGDGTYTIDPDGPGGNAPFSAYCDMTTDDGGWTLVVRMKSNSRAHINTAAMGTLTAQNQADTAKLSDESINAISSEMYRLSCSGITTYYDAAAKDFVATNSMTNAITTYKTTYIGSWVVGEGVYTGGGGWQGLGAGDHTGYTVYGGQPDYSANGCLHPCTSDGSQDGYVFAR
ncbi:MAG: fibrinogen-like YCDxxxxGGGW domain-containing protein [Candidatus Aureabacteria bacterium]|nr:fibrinogen-like YCDxxxxGGGW domain-containing protein [Candidatus Auribacterota bacterium]